MSVKGKIKRLNKKIVNMEKELKYAGEDYKQIKNQLKLTENGRNKWFKKYIKKAEENKELLEENKELLEENHRLWGVINNE